VISTGSFHTCAIGDSATGRVACWGAGGQGQLGNNSQTTSVIPVAVQNRSTFTGAQATAATNFTSLAGMQSSNCGLKADGTVHCWGQANSGQMGNNSPNVSFQNYAAPVTGLSDAVAIAAGINHACAVKANATVVCWGDNVNGQLGDGTREQRNLPALVSGLTGVVAITARGTNTCALKSTGTVACWGLNNRGQVGNGSTGTVLTPFEIPNFTGVLTIGSGDAHTCALKGNGAVYCWGYNQYSQIGTGNNSVSDVLTPTLVAGVSAAAISLGDSHTCAIRPDATVACWGLSGVIGDGTLESRASPTTVTGLTDIAALNSGFRHTCALKTTGAAYCWGLNADGQIGDGTRTDRLSATSVYNGALFWN
jgi:alpha-tubulin suppressor-like RCC1 family protein